MPLTDSKQPVNIVTMNNEKNKTTGGNEMEQMTTDIENKVIEMMDNSELSNTPKCICRFFYKGQNLNILTGTLMPKGVNVINQFTYWKFTKEIANYIASELNVTVNIEN